MSTTIPESLRERLRAAETDWGTTSTGRAGQWLLGHGGLVCGPPGGYPWELWAILDMPALRTIELRPGRDRGTSVITGVSDAQFELLRSYFVEVDNDTGYDAAAEVIARAMANIASGTPTAATVPVPAIESRDLLDDLDAMVGSDCARLADVPALLRDLAPGWGPYRTLTECSSATCSTTPGSAPRTSATCPGSTPPTSTGHSPGVTPRRTTTR